MSKKNKLVIPNPTKGYGYVGVWKYGKEPTLGWCVAPYVSGKSDKKYPSIANNPHAKGERFFLCEILIKPLKDKMGRPLTKIVK